MKGTFYIVPSGLDEPGSQCWIVHREGHWAARESYRANPQNWAEAGLMNFEGKLVCLEGPRYVWDQLKADEPLMAGLEIQYDTEAPRCDTPKSSTP